MTLLIIFLRLQIRKLRIIKCKSSIHEVYYVALSALNINCALDTNIDSDPA